MTLDQGVNTGSAPTSSAALTLSQDTFDLNSSQSITATYIPDNTGNYAASVSAPLTITVGGTHGEVNTTTALSTIPANAINFEDTSTLTFYAIVTNAVVGGYGTPTGNVTFFSNGAELGNGMPVSGSPGTWSITIPQNGDGLLELPLGQSRILAQYTGDSGHAASSAVYTINVYDQNSTPDFAMQSNVTYQTISSGNRTAKFALQFTSRNNLAALGIPIALTYTAPSGITCSGAPAAPNFGNKLYATVNFTCKAAAGVKIGQLAIPGQSARAVDGRGWSGAGLHLPLRSAGTATQVAGADGFDSAVRDRLWRHGMLCTEFVHSADQSIHQQQHSRGYSRRCTRPGHVHRDCHRHCERLYQIAGKHNGERGPQHTAEGRGAVAHDPDKVDKGQAWLALCPFGMGRCSIGRMRVPTLCILGRVDSGNVNFYRKIPVWTCKDTGSHKKLVKEG